MPESPAPMMRTSKCSCAIALSWLPGPVAVAIGRTVSTKRRACQRDVDHTRQCVEWRVTLPSMASSTATPATRPTRGRRAPRVTGDERERAILETFERLLGERPLHEISVDDLARGAGISRPTFYFYFASKQAVLLTLVDR